MEARISRVVKFCALAAKLLGSPEESWEVGIGMHGNGVIAKQ